MSSVEAGSREQPIESPDLFPARESLAAGTGVGPYRILSLIASGGMGDVYRARDERLGREVALKVLPTGLTDDRERLERFAQEAKSASALNHPHIVAIYEIGRARPHCNVKPIGGNEPQRKPSEIHYIAMELIEGETLREFAYRKPPMAQRLELLAQMAEGLGKAHAAGIVHRDLKPDNVMISTEGYAKVVDFGLAKLVEPAHGWNPLGADSPTMRAITQQGELIGTAGYMSPEQILGRAIDQRSDIFSFGCIVYEVITGRRPFDGESFVDTLHEVLHATPPAIQHDELQRIVNKCLVKDRESRYQSIRDVALDLRAAALGPLTMGLPSRTPVPGSRAPGPSVSGLAALAGGWAPTRRATVMGVLIAAAIALAGWVAYVFVPRGPAPVAAVAAPRTVLQRITTNGHIGHLTISPDGRFAGYTVEDDESGSSIWLQQLATGSHIAVVPPTKKTYYAGLTFSADANHLIDTHYEDSIYGVVTERPILGGKLSKLVHDADTGVSPSPDGRWLVMTRNVLDKGESRVLVTARDGSQERIVAALPLPKTALSPVWSPDGKRIAVAHGAGLFTIDAASGVKTGVPLAGRHGVIRDVAWNGNDSVILSAADEHSAGHFQLLRVALPTGTMTTVTSDSDDYIEPRPAGESVAAIQIKHQATLWTVTPGAAPSQVTRGIGSSDGLAGATSTHDGRLVYTSSAGGTIDLWIANADGSDARQLTNDDRLESQPNVTPNDATIVYLTRASGLSTLWRMNIDGSQPRVIAEAQAIYDYALTPDGKRVVYAAGDDRTKRTTLFSIPTDGGAPSPITTTGVYLKAIQISPDGGTVLFSTLHEDLIKVFKVAIGGGAVTRLTDVRSGDASFSPDGKLVACAYEIQEASAKLGILPPGGGKPLQILPLDGRHYHWTPDGKGIAYIKQTGKQENLFLQPLAGGPAKALTNFTEGSIANYEWSRDGSRILLTHYIQTRDVVLLTTTKG